MSRQLEPAAVGRRYDNNDESARYGRWRRDEDRGYASEHRGGARRDDGKVDGGKGNRFDKRDDYYLGRGGRDRSYSWQKGNEGSWWCKECRIDNSQHDDRCRSCGAWESRHNHTKIGHKSRSPDEGRRGDDRDYSGRGSSRRHDNENSDPDEKRRKLEKKTSEDLPIWPPPFDKAGASYIFDTRSGFFYEGASDFFYDPKTKLYYGNKQQAYFQYSQGKEPPYKLMEQAESAVDSPNSRAASSEAAPYAKVVKAAPAVEVADALLVANSSAPTKNKPEKMKIAISLKNKKPVGMTKNSPSMESEKAANIVDTSIPETKASVALTTTPKVQKKHVADMEKWSALGREIQGEGIKDTSDADPSPQPVLKKVAKLVNAAPLPQTSKVTKTAKGEPICLLCRRKFASLEKLCQHERVSALHKQNLAKKTAEEARKKEGIEHCSLEKLCQHERVSALHKQNLAKKTAEEARKKEGIEHCQGDYRDRAKERRLLYGPDAPGSQSQHKEDTPSLTGPSLEKARQVTATEVVVPQECFGEANIGNKMLQKLGWKKGVCLGRKQESALSAERNDRSDVEKKLKEDWERIESLAGGNARKG